jgi:hypothetical protein
VTDHERSLGSRFLRGAEVGDRYGVVLVAISVTYILFSTIERARWSRLLLVAVLARLVTAYVGRRRPSLPESPDAND